MRIFELENQIHSLIEYVSKGVNKKSDKENNPYKMSVKVRNGRNTETNHSRSMKIEDRPPRNLLKPKKSGVYSPVIHGENGAVRKAESKKKRKSSKSRSKSKTPITE